MRPERPLCKDCKWMRRPWFVSIFSSLEWETKCANPAMVTKNLVTGKTELPLALDMRDHETECGRWGSEFEPKDGGKE